MGRPTDELREWLKDRLFMGNGYAELTAIADRIDREHRMAMEKVAADAYLDGAPTEAQLEELGYIKGPMDADGVPVRVGDVMEWPDCYTAEVVGIGDDRFFYVEDGIRYAWASDKIHHHEPTVEDVLEEFVARWMDTHHDDIPALKAEYAAKLRLAGDA